MARKARLDTPGTLHHVIIIGIEKGRIVDDQRNRGNFVFRMGSIPRVSVDVAHQSID